MSDTGSFLLAVAALMCVALSATRVIDFVKGPVVKECTITFSDVTGNRHQFIGKGEVW
jgi:hypothetical protein